MALVYLSIGSNIDRYRHVTSALDALAERFSTLTLSSVYESESVGFNGSPFFNLVVALDTELTVGELSYWLKALEDENGRIRGGAKFAPRTLDVDILSYNDVVGVIDGVELPRGEVLYNAFVLWPLSEIAPDDRHPISQQRYESLWADYDRSKQKLWPIDFTWNGQLISHAEMFS
jgi:2-amino-4-hydroxy-6-hydroxymethyldihydropteridine diphosphokinase